MAEATGTENPFVMRQLIRQVSDTLSLPANLSAKEKEERAFSAVSMLKAIQPQGELEGLLSAQMVATHHVAMDCLARAMVPGQAAPMVDMRLKHAAKLLSIFAKQLEALNKHRGKGQQKIVVQHMNIASDAHATFGNFYAAGVSASFQNSMEFGREKAPEKSDKTAIEGELAKSPKKRRKKS